MQSSLSTRCALRSLGWNWFLAAYVALIAVLLFAPMVAHATQPPPLIDIPPVTAMENAGSMPFVITKTKANSYSRVRIQTVDGTAKAGVDYRPIDVTLTLANNATSTRLPVTLIDNAAYQGTRAFSLKLTVLRFGQVPASYTPITGTITDDEAAPAPPHRRWAWRRGGDRGQFRSDRRNHPRWRTRLRSRQSDARRLPDVLHRGAAAARRSAGQSRPARRLAPPSILRQHRHERLLDLFEPPHHRRHDLRPILDAVQPLGLLVPGDARRRRQRGQARLHQALLQAEFQLDPL
jgi:hypothetical protein